MVLRYWLGADAGSAGDDDAQERYFDGVFGGGISVTVGGTYGNILCGGGYLFDCTYSVG